jgi:hypothetical protein
MLFIDVMIRGGEKPRTSRSRFVLKSESVFHPGLTPVPNSIFVNSQKPSGFWVREVRILGEQDRKASPSGFALGRFAPTYHGLSLFKFLFTELRLIFW